MVLKLGVIFDGLDAQECQAEEHRQNKATEQQIALPCLRAINRHGHREAARNEHHGIDRAEPNVQLMAGGSETFSIQAAIKRISHKQPAEEHDLRNQKHPHAERASFALLLHVLEVMLERGMMCEVTFCQGCSPFVCHWSLV